MSESVNEAGAPASLSEWWSSGDPRVNSDSRTNTAAVTAPTIPQSEAGEYPPHWAASSPAHSPTIRASWEELLLLVSGILVIVGSVTAWVTVSILRHSVSASGTDSSISQAISINGWVTVALGIVLVIMAALMMGSGERSLAAVAVAASAASVGFAIYFAARILHDISKAHSASGLPAAFRASEHIGWGLVVLLLAAVAASVASVSALRSR